MKICKVCNIEQEIDNFNKDSTQKTGYMNKCKSCCKRYRQETREQRKEYEKKYQEENKEKLKDYREINKEKIKNRLKKYYEENREAIIEKSKKYALDNKEQVYEKNKKYRIKNKEKVSKYFREYAKTRAKIDKKFHINRIMSRAISASLKIKNLTKCNASWQTIVGYSISDLISHLESKFTPEMNWDNYGKYWHIDHIKPKSLFIYSSIEDEEFKKCWSLDNLQPLEAIENIRKSNKYQE